MIGLAEGRGLPPRLSTIRLELARGDGFPGGSAAHGYEFTAPLTADGRIDAAAWRRAQQVCVVRRFWRGDDDRHGHLVHTRSRRWVFRYHLDNDPQDDESGWKFDAHRFVAGAYVPITEQDGVTRTFRVAAVDMLGGR